MNNCDAPGVLEPLDHEDSDEAQESEDGDGSKDEGHGSLLAVTDTDSEEECDVLMDERDLQGTEPARNVPSDPRRSSDGTEAEDSDDAEPPPRQRRPRRMQKLE